jgi:hypothetical protein
MTDIIDFENATMEVLAAHGNIIASQQWSGGSWADVYEYKGRYFAADEFGVTECSSACDASEAFEQADLHR